MDEIELSWDETKRQQTLSERGLDFSHMAGFGWDYALTAADTRFNYSEQRYISIGYLGEAVVVCAWCYRDETIRIISLRKANKRERKRYEQEP